MTVHRARGSRVRSVLAVLVLMLAIPMPGAPEPNEPEPSVAEGSTIPEFLWWDVPELPPNLPPIFVRLDRALDAEGRLDPAVFHEAFIDLNKGIFEHDPSEPCIPAGLIDTSDSPAPEWTDYQSVVENYTNLVIAKVADQGHGFFRGSPGTLLRLELVRPLKGDDRWDHKFFFFKAGRMSLGDRTICVSHERYPGLPRTGDEILLAYFLSVDDWIETQGSTLVVLKATGEIGASPWLDQRHPEWRGRPAEALVTEVEHRVRRSGARP